MQRLTTGLVLAFVLALSALAAHAPSASAQEPGMLVIAKDICPPAGPGDDIEPAACTDPAAGVEFFVANPNTDNVEFGATGGDGLVSFPLDRFAISPDGATVDVGELLASNPYGEIAAYLVSCTRNGEPLEFSYQSGDVQPGGATLGIQFTVFEGDQVACNWYNAPLRADPGDPDDDDNGGAVDQLPSTGVGTTADFAIDQRVVVDTGALNVRSGPGLNEQVFHVATSGMLGTVNDGPVVADGYTWYKVAFDAGGDGWVAGEYLAPATNGGGGFPGGTRVVVTADSLNVRAAPGLGGAVVNVLPSGYIAFISDGPVSADGYTWYRLDAMGVTLGWVAGEFLAPA